MKKINYLLMGLLATGATLTSCSSEDVVQKTDELNSVDRAYISVNLVTDQTSTRAGGDHNEDEKTNETFEDGTGNESAANKARFYFFDASGNPYKVNGSLNYVDKDITLTTENEDVHYESETNEPVVIQVSSDLPKLMATVLNPNDEDLGSDNLALSDFNSAKGLKAWTKTGENQFVMTNSVYMDSNNKPIYATSIDGKLHTFTVGNTDQESEAKTAATNEPVDVYVERVLAKVVVTDKDGNAITAETSAYETGSTDERQNTTSAGAIKAKIIGWTLYNTIDKSYLIKKIDTSWDDTKLGFNWNESPKFRSYWAESPANDVTYAGSVNYKDVTIPTALYPQENTNATTHTGVFIAAQLQDANGNAIEIAKYQGASYTVDDLKTAIAGKVTDRIFTLSDAAELGTDGTLNSGTASSISGSDITFDTPKDGTVKDYEVIAKAKDITTLYYKTDDGKYIKDSETSTKVADLLKQQKARIYTEGKTYYFLPIRHLGYSTTATTQPDGAYGVVRNHVYKIQITGIEGLGTPVYKPESETVIPTIPTEENAYVAAKIHVQAWRVVNNDVVFK